MFKDWSASYDDLLGRANMASLFNNRLQDIAIFMYKIKHRMLPSIVVEIFNTDSTGYGLRNADFRSQRFDTIKYGKHSKSINFIINNHQRDVTKVAKRMLFKTVAFAYGTCT